MKDAKTARCVVFVKCSRSPCSACTCSAQRELCEVVVIYNLCVWSIWLYKAIPGLR